MTTLTVAELSRDIEGFLQFKRALGHVYGREQCRLRNFERFVREHSDSKFSLEDMLSGWLARAEGRKSITAWLDLSVVRQLCLYRRRRDPHGFVPDRYRGWAQPRKRTFRPYIFTREEVLQLLDAAERHHGPNMSATMLRTLLLILYCTGLRFGEAVRLQLKDVDLEHQLFVVRESKGKTRIVPFQSDLASRISTYISEREPVARAMNAGGGALFLYLNGSPLTVHGTSVAVRRLLRRAGFKPPKGRVGPRPYDLRHAFAVARLTEWYRKGLDIQARLPLLSAYMGHDNILGTEVYLHATPALMQLASQRFAVRLDLKRRR